jgi:uncharacterized membrane protein
LAGINNILFVYENIFLKIFVLSCIYLLKNLFLSKFKDMNATIGIYDNHDLAVEAVQKLKDNDFHVSKLSIMGLTNTEVVDEEMHITEQNPIKAAGLGTGTVVGTTLGILTGVGLFAIPGVGCLYGAGALVGAIAGFDFGIMGGGIASVLATIGVKNANAKKYHDALVAGKYLVLIHGNDEEVSKAKDILHAHDTHSDLEQH